MPPIGLPGQALGAQPLTPPSGGIQNEVATEDYSHWKKIISAAERAAAQNRADYDKFLRLFKEGQFKMKDGSAAGVSVNETFSYVQMINALLYAQSPAIEIESREGGDGASFGPIAQIFGMDPAKLQEQFAETIEQFERYAAEETQADGANNVALQEMSIKGLAWSKIHFDPIRKMSTVDTLRRDEIYVDPQARYSMGQAEYIIHINVMRFSQAEAFFAPMGPFSPLKANWSLSDGDSDEAKKNASDKKTEKDQFKFYEIWLRRDGEKKILYMAYHADDWLCPEQPWPFTLNDDQFPFVPWQQNTLNQSIGDAFPEIAVVDGLRETVEECCEFMRRHNLRAMAKPVLLDADVFDDAMVEKIEAAKDLTLLRISKGGKEWNELAHVLDLNTPNDPTPNVAEFFQNKKQKILGESELEQSGAQRKLTATQAEIVDEYGKLRMGKRQKIVDGCLTAQLRIRVQIDRQLADPECVAKLVGKMQGMLWSLYAGNAEDFLREYSVGIAAGSTGERAAQQRIQRLKDFLGAIISRNERLMSSGAPPRWDEDAVIVELARANKLRRPERYQLAPPPPQPAPAPMQMPPNGPGQPAPGPMPGGPPSPGPQPTPPAGPPPGMPGPGGPNTMHGGNRPAPMQPARPMGKPMSRPGVAA